MAEGTIHEREEEKVGHHDHPQTPHHQSNHAQEHHGQKQNEPPLSRDKTPAKNVEQTSKPVAQSGREPTQPSYPGPGSNATASETAKPHSSKVLNKLDPRFDEDILETAKREQYDK